MRNIVRHLIVALLVPSLAPPLTAQADQTFSETLDVHLVTLDVRVEGFLGTQQPIDLTREAFELLEDGELREITHFERVRNGQVENLEPTRTERPYQSPGEAETLTQYMVLAFDLASLSRPRLKRAINDAVRFTQTTTSPTLEWSVVALAQILHRFSYRSLKLSTRYTKLSAPSWNSTVANPSSDGVRGRFWPKTPPGVLTYQKRPIPAGTLPTR